MSHETSPPPAPSNQTEEFETTLPPVIVALDQDSPDKAADFVEVLSELPVDKVGLKIARWHDQHEALRRQCAETGRFVVLDTQLNDGSVKMAAAAQYLLQIAGGTLVPDAITMHPFKEITRGDRQFIKTNIIDLAHEYGASVIAHSEQTRLNPRDQMLHETERFLYLSEATDRERPTFGLDVIELHADTVLTFSYPYIREKRPLVIASRFGIGIDVNERRSEADIIDQVSRVSAMGAHSIYLGQSVMRSLEPLEFIDEVLRVCDRTSGGNER